MSILDLMKMTESSPKGWKTLWEKEKLFVTSNFSFSHCVFIRRVGQTCKNQGLFGKGLTYSKIKCMLQFSPKIRVFFLCAVWLLIHPIRTSPCFYMWGWKVSWSNDYNLPYKNMAEETGVFKHFALALIDWMVFYTAFNSNFSHTMVTAHIIHVFPGFHRY